MSLNRFLGPAWTKARLEAELAQVQADIAAGKQTIDGRSGEAMIRSLPDMSLDTRYRQILKALHILDPTTYPIEDITPDSATRMVFGSASTAT